MPPRAYRAGETIEDYCRACKTDRLHTVMAADPGGRPIRVVCDYCRSEHNYRGGPRIEPGRVARTVPSAARSGPPDPLRPLSANPLDSPRSFNASRASTQARETFPLVSDRERTAPPMSSDATADLELLLRRIIREETGITPVTPADKWRGGSLVLRPGTPGLQEKSWPIETFFHKVVMLRNRLRTLEQQLNASELPDDVKVRLQGYITGCYGSLTSFNVLFAEDDDQFKGSSGD
jgi:hypothetical protein